MVDEEEKLTASIFWYICHADESLSNQDLFSWVAGEVVADVDHQYEMEGMHDRLAALMIYKSMRLKDFREDAIQRFTIAQSTARSIISFNRFSKMTVEEFDAIFQKGKK